MNMETSKEVALTICEKIQNEYPDRPLWQTMLEIEDLIDKHVAKQLTTHGVVKSFNSEEELLEYIYLIMPFAVKPKNKKKFEFVQVFKSAHAFEFVCKHLAKKLFNVC